ncbi:MAG: ABC transporter ATP-binding protein [Lachnospiraceae bacterium]|nr:ABC transporter ATP-binding protein [Lachnospiraceae bacterium]
MKTMLKYMRAAHWRLFALTALFMFIQTWLDLKLPDYMSDITELVQTGKATTGALLHLGAYMLLCAVGTTLMAITSNYTSARMAASFSRDLRSSIFHKVQTFSKEEIDRFSTASLITRSTNDVVQIQNFVSRGLRMLVRVPIIVGLALVKISTRYWQWTAVTGLTVLLVLSVIVILIKYAHPRFRRMQRLTDEVNRTMQENMTGMRVIRAYNAEEYQMNAFETANFNLMDNERKARSVMLLMPSTNQFANNALTVAIYCIGAYPIMKAGSPGEQLLIFTDMVVFSTYASKMLMGVSSLEMIFNMLPRASTSAERIAEILNTDSTIVGGGYRGTEADADRKGGSIEFRNVSFSYPGTAATALKDVSFRADSGETIGIIGSTASGKTSLVSLIPRLYDATEGEVLVDGKNVRDYDTDVLRSKLSYVTQGAVLFTGTVASNVSYGKKTGFSAGASDAGGTGTASAAGPASGTDAAEDPEKTRRIWNAIDIAQAREFVEKMGGKLKGVVNRGGSNISGGQKQRLAIARGVYRDPEIYIFDDAFSALDYKTDRTLREALKDNFEGATVLIVASRIATIRNADRIIVLDGGSIVGEGSHEELMKNCNVYREIAYTQLSEEELK